jgi:hypothetical protein
MPNIAVAIIVINTRHTAPTQLHMKQLKCLLRYLNGTKPMVITYGRPSQDNAEDSKVLSYSDWAASTMTTKRSQSGEVAMLNGGAISWTSKQREVVALSTTKAEYVVVSHA